MFAGTLTEPGKRITIIGYTEVRANLEKSGHALFDIRMREQKTL